jgi:hypothetical protein
MLSECSIQSIENRSPTKVLRGHPWRTSTGESGRSNKFGHVLNFAGKKSNFADARRRGGGVKIYKMLWTFLMDDP